MRAPEQVRRIKAQLVGTNISVVAKVETAEAVEQLATILRDADLIMIDRGDLEAEIGRENVPLAQKAVIKKAREAHVPVIVASQFMTSMLEKPRAVHGRGLRRRERRAGPRRHPDALGGDGRREVPGRVHRHDEARSRRPSSGRSTANTAPSSSRPGPSTGFGSLTTNKHKCMLDVGGTTIVSHQLENLRACGIRDDRITVVTGHNHAQIEHYLRGEGFGGSFVYNPGSRRRTCSSPSGSPGPTRIS